MSRENGDNRSRSNSPNDSIDDYLSSRENSPEPEREPPANQQQPAPYRGGYQQREPSDPITSGTASSHNRSNIFSPTQVTRSLPRGRRGLLPRPPSQFRGGYNEEMAQERAFNQARREIRQQGQGTLPSPNQVHELIRRNPEMQDPVMSILLAAYIVNLLNRDRLRSGQDSESDEERSTASPPPPDDVPRRNDRGGPPPPAPSSGAAATSATQKFPVPSIFNGGPIR